MKKFILVILVLIFVGISIANAEQVYYCSGKLTTGFKLKDDGNWRVSKFEKERYTIKFNDEYTSLRGLHKGMPWTCGKPYEGLFAGALTCFDKNNNGDFFSFDRKGLYFVLGRGSVNGFLFPIAKTEVELIAGDCESF